MSPALNVQVRGSDQMGAVVDTTMDILVTLQDFLYLAGVLHSATYFLPSSHARKRYKGYQPVFLIQREWLNPTL